MAFETAIIFLYVGLIFAAISLFTRKLQIIEGDKYKYRLFELRDKFALLAMSGKIDENAVEYKAIIKSINALINLTDKYNLARLFEEILSFSTNENYQKKIFALKRKLDKCDTEVVCLLHEYYRLQVEIVKKNSVPDIFLFKVAIMIYPYVSNIIAKSKSLLELKDAFKAKIGRTNLVQDFLVNNEKALENRLCDQG